VSGHCSDCGNTLCVCDECAACGGSGLAGVEREPTDADIERASLAVYAEDCIRRNVDEEPWRLAARWRDVLDEPERERYRRMAQAAAKAFRRSR
jgi:hypothetical protein